MRGLINSAFFCVTGGLKVLNFGGIKMPTSMAFDSRIKGCIDAEMEGLFHTP
jgi:hypothetical protein